jgi:hypothetical protein
MLRCSAVTGDGRSVATTDSFSPSRHQSPVTSLYKFGNQKKAFLFHVCLDFFFVRVRRICSSFVSVE